jgi:glutathione synthase/RimK-type ligase-like ATP-grasp enzyme
VGEFVVKPAVGAGALDTARYDAADRGHRRLAAEHMTRLAASGRTAMVQPYLAEVDTAGETGVVHLGGRASHAFRKDALLDGPSSVVNGLYREESTLPRIASPCESALAEAALAAVARVAPAPEPLLYSRVDMVAGADGRPVVLEVELTEPSLYLVHSAGAVDRFAEAIAARVGDRRDGNAERIESGGTA